MCDQKPPGGAVAPPWLALGGGCALWFAGFYLTPGILEDGDGSFLTADPDAALVLETVAAGILALGLLVIFRRVNRTIFALCSS